MLSHIVKSDAVLFYATGIEPVGGRKKKGKGKTSFHEISKSGATPHTHIGAVEVLSKKGSVPLRSTYSRMSPPLQNP